MTRRSRKIVAGLSLVLCLVVLGRFVLFKKPLGYYRQYFLSESKRADAIRANKANNNYVLFATIKKFYKSRHLRPEYKMDNIGGNILGFIPLGFLFPFVWHRRFRALVTVLFCFFVSLSFEVIQLKTGIGVFDVDDLFLNTLGGAIGMIVFFALSWMFKPASGAGK